MWREERDETKTMTKKYNRSGREEKDGEEIKEQ